MQTQFESITSTPKPPVLQSYTDYREYLQSFYLYKKNLFKNELRGYTYAHFSAAADIKSPNYLKLIIDGKRNLSAEMMLKFAKALELNRDDSKEFQALVEYSQAKEPLERNKRLKILSELRLKKRIKAGEAEQTTGDDNVNSWVIWAVYSLLDQRNVSFDIPSLRKTLKGRARADEIKKALDQLIAAGDVLVDETTGLYKRSSNSLSSMNGLSPDKVKALQAELIYLGLESLLQDDPNEREFGSLMLTLTEEEFEKLKFELRHLRKRFLKDTLLERETKPGDRVYQFNVQLFPVSDKT